MQSACAILYWHLWPPWLYNIFPHYLINGTTFRENVTEDKMCFDFLYNSEIFLILKILLRDILINVETSSCKVPVILVRF